MDSAMLEAVIPIAFRGVIAPELCQLAEDKGPNECCRAASGRQPDSSFSSEHVPQWQSGSSASIRLVAPAGRNWTAIVLAAVLPLFVILCTMSPPSSTNPCPAV